MFEMTQYNAKNKTEQTTIISTNMSGRGFRPGHHPYDRNKRSNDSGRNLGFMKPADYDTNISNGSMVLEDRTGPAIGGDYDSIMTGNVYTGLSIGAQRARLPIAKNKRHILYLLHKFRTLVIVGETGCGKSTQIPQYLIETGWCSDGRLIGITQPRRVAAVTLAARVAEEANVLLGHEVGYTVRFDDATNERTKIKYMTDGILLREMLTDPLLSKYCVIMVDEAHERTTNSDILLGLLKKITTLRHDLKLIISSATLDAEMFRDFFEMNETRSHSNDTATILSVEGRTHPVTVYYTQTAIPNYITTAVEIVTKIHKEEHMGDILVFLTGQDEVEDACKRLREAATKFVKCDKLWVVPFYGSLPSKEQMKAFDSPAYGTRKVVVATNIAEASVTIPGITYVIDCGYVKLRALNPKNGMESLMKLPISRASAEQRAGRAGRIRPGKAYRLYTESEFENMSESTVPEIQRCDLAPMLLQMKALGIQNIHRFHYLSRPCSSSVISALELLFSLKALDAHSRLTIPVGVQMSEFPLPPMHTKCLINSGLDEFACSEEMVSIIAMLQIQNVFLVPPAGQARRRADIIRRKFSVAEGDHLTYLNVYTKYVDNRRSSAFCHSHFLNYRGLQRVDEVRAQLVALMKRNGIRMVSCRHELGTYEKIARCLTSGFFTQAASFHYSGKYRSVKNDYPFSVYKGSAIMFCKNFPKWVIFSEVMADSLRDITVIEQQWLYELAPDYYVYGTDAEVARKATEESPTESDDEIS